MKVRIKQVMSIAYILLFILSSLELGWLDLRVQAASNVIETTYDVNKTFTGLEHTHIWSFYYDDLYHWQQCDICGLVNNKHEHVMTENNGSKDYCLDSYNKAFRYICTCGYTTKPLVVIHGRAENYKDENSYSNASRVWLYNVMQITKAQFNTWYGGRTHDGHAFTWYDYDGDGYGHVFCGGIIESVATTTTSTWDSYGVRGTLTTIIGSEGDKGKNNPADEYMALGLYYNSDKDSPTKAEFIEYLKEKINSKGQPTTHALYGYVEKYQRISDAQFNKIMVELEDTVPHVQGW